MVEGTRVKITLTSRVPGQARPVRARRPSPAWTLPCPRPHPSDRVRVPHRTLSNPRCPGQSVPSPAKVRPETSPGPRATSQ